MIPKSSRPGSMPKKPAARLLNWYCCGSWTVIIGRLWYVPAKKCLRYEIAVAFAEVGAVIEEIGADGTRIIRLNMMGFF